VAQRSSLRPFAQLRAGYPAIPPLQENRRPTPSPSKGLKTSPAPGGLHGSTSKLTLLVSVPLGVTIWISPAALRCSKIEPIRPGSATWRRIVRMARRIARIACLANLLMGRYSQGLTHLFSVTLQLYSGEEPRLRTDRQAPDLGGQTVAPVPLLGRGGPEGLGDAAPNLPVQSFLAVVTARIRRRIRRSPRRADRAACSPSLRALNPARALPRTVRGPVDFWAALARRAAREAGVRRRRRLKDMQHLE
jgi:hypothetical protein